MALIHLLNYSELLDRIGPKTFVSTCLDFTTISRAKFDLGEPIIQDRNFFVDKYKDIVNKFVQYFYTFNKDVGEDIIISQRKDIAWLDEKLSGLARRILETIMFFMKDREKGYHLSGDKRNIDGDWIKEVFLYHAGLCSAKAHLAIAILETLGYFPSKHFELA